MKKFFKKSYDCDNKFRRRTNTVIKGFLFSFIITVPTAIILSVAMAITDFPEEYMSPAVLITVIISIFASGVAATAPEENLGWIGGSISGLLYMTVIMVIRWCLESRIYIDKDIITLLLCGALLGTISGMAGLSIGQKSRSKHRGRRHKNTAPIHLEPKQYRKTI